MCGITGLVNFEDSTLLHNMCNQLKHRGPDADGFFEDKNIGLGIRRLSIIDVEGGNQPISNEDQQIWIVFNGEIYNYKEIRSLLKKITLADMQDNKNKNVLPAQFAGMPINIEHQVK